MIEPLWPECVQRSAHGERPLTRCGRHSTATCRVPIAQAPLLAQAVVETDARAGSPNAVLDSPRLCAGGRPTAPERRL